MYYKTNRANFKVPCLRPASKGGVRNLCEHTRWGQIEVALYAQPFKNQMHLPILTELFSSQGTVRTILDQEVLTVTGADMYDCP